MRLPLEIAMEVGSFLDRPSLTVCTAQLCRSGVGFVSRPRTDSASVTRIRLQILIPLCRSIDTCGGDATEVIQRIDQCLARRSSSGKVVFDVYQMRDMPCYVSTDFYSHIHRHFQVSANRQFNNGPSLVVEWHARTESIWSLAFLLGKKTGGRLDDGCPLESCQSLHALDLSWAEVRDISLLASCHALRTLILYYCTQLYDLSALASCQALHTLDLNNTRVNDLSALASCQALHTLHLNETRVSDVSPLASCQALHTLHLNETQVSDVSPLASCPALHTLLLKDTPVSDVSALASCQALHTLDLMRTDVDDVSALASLQALHTLNLNQTQVHDISALASCQALHTLLLNSTQVYDVDALASCQALHTLDITYTEVFDVSALASCQALHTLQLHDIQVNDASVSALGAKVRLVVELY